MPSRVRCTWHLSKVIRMASITIQSITRQPYKMTDADWDIVCDQVQSVEHHLHKLKLELLRRD